MTSLDAQPNRRVSLTILILLGLWIISLLVASLWFQNQYVKPFTKESTFLQPNLTQAWFDDLLPLLPAKQSQHRLIQFWHPDCLCNRFAREHAIKAIASSRNQGVEHITVIPKAFEARTSELQSLNPDTRIITLDRNAMTQWPNSPAVLLEDALHEIQFFGPLGFGAFCSQASTSLIDRQITQLNTPHSQPFFNVIGQGCFCPW